MVSVVVFCKCSLFSDSFFVKGMLSYIDLYVCFVSTHTPGQVVRRKKTGKGEREGTLYGGRRVVERIGPT